MKTSLNSVLIMAAGTGGHVFPGIALAEGLRAQNISVSWLGTTHGMEAKWVKDAGIPFYAIAIKGLRGKGRLAQLLAPFKMLIALIQAIRILINLKPDVVVGMGGFVAGPGGLAAWLLRIPLVIHEQNAIAGMTNRILAHLSKRVLQGFPNAFAASKKVITVGNPVRKDIEDAHVLPPSAQNWHLLILGGSLGAEALNRLMPEALSKMAPADWPTITHQTGEKHYSQTLAAYEAKGLKPSETLIIQSFISEMNKAYHAADMVLCRAGALTVAELCSVGRGAILVPYPYAVDDHQTVNASFMVKNGAAICIQQFNLNADNLAESLTNYAKHPELRKQMSEAAFSLRQEQVVEKIVKILREVCAVSF